MNRFYKIFGATCGLLFSVFFAGNTLAQLGPVNFTLPSNPPAADINAMEYFLNADPGFGNGTAIPLTPSGDILLNNTPIGGINSLPLGIHKINIRALSTSGNWSHSSVFLFYVVSGGDFIPTQSAANVEAMEYFFNADPGFGNGTSINIPPGTDVRQTNIALTGVEALAVGVNQLTLRYKDVKGNWSHNNTILFYVVSGGDLIPPQYAANITAMEYFFNADPGFGNGTSINVPPGTDIHQTNIALTGVEALEEGVHNLTVRYKDADGNWSHSNKTNFLIASAEFNIKPNPAIGTLTAIEYFFDTDPGFGNGFIEMITGTSDLVEHTIAANISGLADGEHTLFIRTLNGGSHTIMKPFIIGSVLPVTWVSLSGKVQVDQSVFLQWEVASEQNNSHYEVERSADGTRFSTIGKVAGQTSGQSNSTYRYIDSDALAGNSFYRIKQVDLDGKYSHSTTIKMVKRSTESFYVINNPVKDKLLLHIGQEIKAGASISLMDVSGKIVQKKSVLNSGIMQIDASNLPSGMYFVHFINGDQKETGRFVK